MISFPHLSQTDISKHFKKGEIVTKIFTVTKDITTNRTSKPGDDILSTPGIVSKMDELCAGLVSDRERRQTAMVTHVNIKHKAPLNLNEKFLLKAKVIDLSHDGVLFRVGCSHKDRILAEADIQVNSFPPIL